MRFDFTIILLKEALGIVIQEPLHGDTNANIPVITPKSSIYGRSGQNMRDIQCCAGGRFYIKFSS